MNKHIARIISIVLLSAFSANTACYGLATLPASQNPIVKREILATLQRTQIRFAESEDAVRLLNANNASCLLLSSGKYLVTKEVAQNDLKLLRATIHEDIEAIMQIIAKEDRSRYQGIKELILKHVPPHKDNDLSIDLYVNHTIARAFEWLILLNQGQLQKSDVSQGELSFLEKIKPIIDASRNSYFTAEFWDARTRSEKIRTALNNGMRFYLVGSEKEPQSLQKVVTPALPTSTDIAPIDVSELVKFHNQFQELVRENKIGQETPEGYRVSLRELIRVTELLKQFNGKVSPELALAWSIREVYFKRLQTEKDKDAVKSLIYNMASLKGIDLEPIFGSNTGEIEDLLEEYGSPGAYLMYHTKGTLPKEAAAIIIQIARLLKTGEPGNIEAAISLIGSINPELAFEILKLSGIPISASTIELYEDLGKTIKDDSKKIELLTALKESFKDSNGDVYWSAAASCGQIAATILDASKKIELLNALKELFNGDMDVRWRKYGQIAATILDASKKIELLNALKELFKDSNENTRSSAAESYGPIAASLQDDAKKIELLNALKELFKDSKEYVRAHAASSYGPIAVSIIDDAKKIETLYALKELFKDDDWNASQSAITSYGQIAATIQDDSKKIKLLNVLKELFKDDDRDVRQSTAASCGQIAATITDESKKIAILDALKDLLKDSYWNVRRSAAASCGQIAASLQDDSKKIELLTALKVLFKDRDYGARMSAAASCGQIAATIQDESKKIKLLDDLKELFNDDNWAVRQYAATSYGQIAASLQDEPKKIELLNALKELFKDSEWGVRHYAATSYVQIVATITDDSKKIELLNALKELFKDSDHGVREFAATSYFQIAVTIQDASKKIELLNALEELFKDDDMRQSAAAAYAKIASSILSPHKAVIESLYQSNRARYNQSYSTNVTQLKPPPYEIRVDNDNHVIQGIVSDTVVVEQRILTDKPIDESAILKEQGIILTPRAKRDLIDILFFTSQDKLNPIFFLGPTATGKTSLVRYLSSLVGKEFSRIQINAQTDELDLLGHFMPKGLSISYEEAATIIQEHINTSQMSKLQHALSILLPTEDDKKQALSDADFAKRQIESALYLKEDKADLVRSIGHILLHGTSGIELDFKKARFLESLERGDWILLDEMNLAREESLGILYGLLTRGYLEIDGKDGKKEKISPKKNGGMIFAAGNPASDVGRQVFSEALENRFQIFYTPRMISSEIANIVFHKYPIEGISLADLESLVELNKGLQRLMEDNMFKGFENERPYQFTIRNIEAILINTTARLKSQDNKLSPLDALMKEIYIEYSDIMKYSPKDIELLKKQIESFFKGYAHIPEIDLSFNESKDTQIDGISLIAPQDTAKQNKSLIPTKADVDLVMTDSTIDTTRAILYGFRNPRRPVMLIGQTAAGKTETVLNTARILKWQYHSENLRDTALSSLIGNWARDANTGILGFKDGILIEAMKNGYCLVLEEINFMDTGLLEVISEWIDEGYFTNPKTHERIAIHPDFRLFATLNPIQGSTRISLGRNNLPAPFINRFKLVWVNEKGAKEEFTIVKELLERAGISVSGKIEDAVLVSAGSKGAAEVTSGSYSNVAAQKPSGAAAQIVPHSASKGSAPLSGQNPPQAIRALTVTGEQHPKDIYKLRAASQDAADAQAPAPEQSYIPDRELNERELSELLAGIERDPQKREVLREKIRIFSSFFIVVTQGKIRIKPGNNWAYYPKREQEALTYPIRDILDTETDKLVGLGAHEGMHRYGTRYIDFMPFMDKLTNLLFNAAEDVTIERWGRHLMAGIGKFFETKNKIADSEEWLKGHFGDDIPEHIKFIFGILYYGDRSKLPDILKGKARDALERDDIKQALEDVFDGMPKVRDPEGNISVNKEPTTMEITAAAKFRVDIMRDKILPIYKKLLSDRALQLGSEGKKLSISKGEAGQDGKAADEIDLDSLPEDIRRELEKEIEKFSKELEDKTKEGTADWKKAQDEKKDKEGEAKRLERSKEADKLTAERPEREKEGRKLSDAERFKRKIALEDRLKRSFNEYQLNLDVVRRLVHSLTGQLSNIIREDTKPKWIEGLRKGKDIAWDRFFASSMSGFSDDKYWRDRTIPTKRSIKFTLVIDESGSMSGARGENAILSAIVFMDVLQNLGVDFNVRGFGDNTYLHKKFRSQDKPDDVRKTYDTVKERDELITELSQSMATGGCTADGDAVSAALEDIKDNGAEKNVVLVLTDGEGNSGLALSGVLKEAEDSGVKVIGIGIGEGIEYVAKNYKSYVQVSDIEMLPVEFRQIIKKEMESLSRLSKNLARGQVNELKETHPALDQAANDGRMFAMTLDRIGELQQMSDEALADLLVSNLIHLRSPPETRQKLLEYIQEPSFREKLLKGFILMSDSVKDQPLPQDKPIRLCIVIEDENLPTIVFKDPYNNLIAHSGEGKKTDTPYTSIYAGYNSLQVAISTSREDSFKGIMSHEASDIIRGYHDDDMPQAVSDLYDSVIDLYDANSATVLLSDLMYAGLQDNRVYEIKYDASKLSASQIAIIEEYIRLLQARSSTPDNIRLKPFSSAQGSKESLIAVYSTGKDFKGEGHVDVAIPDGELKEYLLKITGMINIALASSNIPDNLSKEEVDKYRPIMSYIKNQYKAILGEELAIPDSPEDILKAIRRIVLGLPKSMRMNTGQIEEFNRLAKQALIAA